MSRALRSLALRAHSEQEIVDKLTRAGFEERAIAAAMAELSKYGLVNDAQFADDWVQQRARRGMGSYRIAQELRHKGIDSETAQEAIDAIDEEEALRVATEQAVRFLGRGNPDTAKRRAYDSLLRRGYSYSMARTALETALAQIEEEEDDEE